MADLKAIKVVGMSASGANQQLAGFRGLAVLFGNVGLLVCLHEALESHSAVDWHHNAQQTKPLEIDHLATHLVHSRRSIDQSTRSVHNINNDTSLAGIGSSLDEAQPSDLNVARKDVALRLEREKKLLINRS